MAYRIVYGPEPSAARRRQEHRGRRLLLTGCFFLLFVASVRVLWPEGCAALAHLLLPGDPEVTVQAFRVMLDQWAGGAGFEDALAAFCSVILNHGVVF